MHDKYAPPKPTSQDRLKAQYAAIEAEEMPEGLDRYQQQTWEKQRLQRLIECESAARFDAIAGELGLSISANESKALWEKSQGKVVDRAAILYLFKETLDLDANQIARIDRDLELCTRDKYLRAGLGIPLR